MRKNKETRGWNKGGLNGRNQTNFMYKNDFDFKPSRFNDISLKEELYYRRKPSS